MPVNGVVDLALVVPETPIPSTITVVSHEDRLAAEAARDEAVTAAAAIQGEIAEAVEDYLTLNPPGSGGLDDAGVAALFASATSTRSATDARYVTDSELTPLLEAKIDASTIGDALAAYFDANPIQLFDTDGFLPITQATPGSVVFSEVSTARPTARTDIRCIFTSEADPSSAMVTGDIWARREVSP